MVPAATSGAAFPPCAIELHGVPVAETFLTQSIWSQVADLQSRKLPCEIIKGHPRKFK